MPHSEQLHTVERWTRIDAGHLATDVTIDDPGTFTRPFTGFEVWNLDRRVKQRIWSAAFCALMIGCGPANQPAPRTDRASRPDLSGMWSDPPATAVDDFCFMTCTDEGIARLSAFLDDPANDSRPYQELSREARSLSA